MSSNSSDSEASERSGGVGGEQEGGNESDSAPSHRSASPPPMKIEPQSESESGSPVKKRVMSSDDDDEDEDRVIKKKSESSALFGEDVSSSEGEGSPRRRVESDEEGGEQRESQYNEGEEEEQEEEAPPINIDSENVAVDMDIPSFKPTFVRLPNFLSVAKKPFDPSYYEEDDDDDALDPEGRNRLKLKVENTVRWRSIIGEDGEELKESNAKMVRWSDGTMSMYLGNEIFDVQTLEVNDHNHLFIRQGTGLVGQAVFQQKLNFRPHSTESATHKKVTLTMADRTRKSGQVKMISNVGNNPDSEKQELVRKEEEALRAAYRRDLAQGRTRTKGRYSGLSSSFLEGRDHSDDESSLNAIKGRYQKVGGSKYDGPLIGQSDSDDSDDGEKRLKDAQKDSDDDSDDSAIRNKTKQKKTIVTSDEESD